MTSSSQTGSRPWIMVFVALVLAGVLYAQAPIAQDQAYHAFADQRDWLAIPHFSDVISNLPFLIIGLMGIRYLLRAKDLKARPGYRAWMSFFIGVALVAPGSAYYHWNPNDHTLIWDRLPMTLAFMGVLCALLSEIVTPQVERFLGVFLGLGLASVWFWASSGDLSFYIWVQALSFGSILLLCILYPDETRSDRGKMILAFLAYGLAKFTESRDTIIFEMTRGGMSGHTIKHLLAAMAIVYLFQMLKARKVIP